MKVERVITSKNGLQQVLIIERFGFRLVGIHFYKRKNLDEDSKKIVFISPFEDCKSYNSLPDRSDIKKCVEVFLKNGFFSYRGVSV